MGCTHTVQPASNLAKVLSHRRKVQICVRSNLERYTALLLYWSELRNKTSQVKAEHSLLLSGGMVSPTATTLDSERRKLYEDHTSEGKLENT